MRPKHSPSLASHFWRRPDSASSLNLLCLLLTLIALAVQFNAFGANSLIPLKQVSLAPGYFASKMDILLARDLFPEQRVGDEPEPLEVIPWPLNRIDALLEREDFTESRSISALLLTIKWLAEQEK